MAVLALGVRRRCIYVALAGKPGCQVGPGPGWPRDTTNLPQQPSWIPFLLTLFFFPPQSISLSFSLNFSFLLAFFIFPSHLISLSSSLYFSFLLTLLLFPARLISLSSSLYFCFLPHSISLSSSLYFSFLLTLFLSSSLFFALTLAKFLVLRGRVTRQHLTRKGQEGKDSS